ncbi:hypothetical protein JCM6882_005725 [Rhodosporidiobolus microsporus]
MSNRTATVHVYEPPGAVPLRADDEEHRRSLAARLLASCSEPARSSASAAFVQLQRPLETSPSSKAYNTHPPASLSPKNLRRAHPDLDAEDDDSPASLPSFAHWRPRPPPSSPSEQPAPLAPTPSLAAAGTQTQGILRKRTVGAWAPPAATGEREKKKVRVESPRSTATAARGGREGGARELVPATPEDDMAARSKGEEVGQPELGEGAVQRCIPYPYCHTDTIPCTDPNPARQHPARILHSFADPSFTSPPAPTTGTSSSLAQSHSLVRANSASGTSQLSQLATTSPKTLAFLQPGRRGSWLVPISAALPIPHTSPARWFAHPLAPSAASTSSPTRPIYWTDDRLRALWTLVDSLHQSGGLGSLRATCHIPPPTSSSSPDSSTPSLLSYLKITTDAHLALPLRGVLNQVNVKALLLSSSSSATKSRRSEEGNGEEKKAASEDAEKFLKGRALVWVDEMGRAVLTA